MREGLRLVLERPSASLSATFLALLQEQYSELLDWDRKIAHYTARIERAVEADPGARRLRAVPGIGALTASALLAKGCHAGAYGNGRHFAAAPWGWCPATRAPVASCGCWVSTSRATVICAACSSMVRAPWSAR
ncbi:MAG: hypothetical protein M5R42_01630 [Rhodocyclaceae bacterium]|nr:hypothetical protein [Rhodocyclaceae bacterium]